MSRTLKLTLLVVAIGLVPLLIVGVLITQRESDSAAVDSALVSRANVQATELEAGFARGRTIALLMSNNPSFGDFYVQPGSRVEKVAAQGPTIDRVHRALSYLETLYPGQIGEACFIDRSGVENARVVRGSKALPSELSNESKNAFFKPSFAQKLGGVYQSPPYVSPDTGEWVIGTTTPIPGPSGAVAGIVHFELTIDSFRTAAARFSGSDEVAIVDADTGAVLVNSRRPQRIGATLGDPSDRRFVGLPGSRGLVERGNSRIAYRAVAGGTTNNWMVVAVAPQASGISTLPIAAVLLALIALALAMGRRWSRTSEQAETDPLTGLGNRRKLDADLSRLLPATDQSTPLTLCVYDLNGFKNYNDAFGHPAGDALLARFGLRLATAAPEGAAYRLGGDEFCVLIGGSDSAVDAVLARTLDALADHGDGWEIDCACGIVQCRPTHGTPRAHSGSPTNGCTRPSGAGAVRRAVRAPTCCCRHCASAIRTSAPICMASAGSPQPSASGWGSTPKSSRCSASPASFTTSARSRSPTRSSPRRGRWILTSGRSSISTR